jgi:histidine triad (HIT) family protein
MRCIFCTIARGEAEASLLHMDERCIAFMDLEPVTPGHLLVVPRAHATGLADLAPETGAHLFTVAQRCAGALKASSLPGGDINLVLADGAAAGQTVFHVHLHVILRHSGDGFGFRFPPAYPRHPPRTELDRHATELRGLVHAAHASTPGDS